MPFSISLTESPGRIEATRYHRESAENRNSKFRYCRVRGFRSQEGPNSGRIDPPGGARQQVADQMRDLKTSRESHDVYENAGTYAGNTRFDRKCITLITSRLADRLELSQGELKVKAKATMLQKTKEVDWCNWVKATILMKINDLKF